MDDLTREQQKLLTSMYKEVLSLKKLNINVNQYAGTQTDSK